MAAATKRGAASPPTTKNGKLAVPKVAIGKARSASAKTVGSPRGAAAKTAAPTPASSPKTPGAKAAAKAPAAKASAAPSTPRGPPSKAAAGGPPRTPRSPAQAGAASSPAAKTPGKAPGAGSPSARPAAKTVPAKSGLAAPRPGASPKSAATPKAGSMQGSPRTPRPAPGKQEAPASATAREASPPPVPELPPEQPPQGSEGDAELLGEVTTAPAFPDAPAAVPEGPVALATPSASPEVELRAATMDTSTGAVTAPPEVDTRSVCFGRSSTISAASAASARNSLEQAIVFEGVSPMPASEATPQRSAERSSVLSADPEAHSVGEASTAAPGERSWIPAMDVEAGASPQVSEVGRRPSTDRGSILSADQQSYIAQMAIEAAEKRSSIKEASPRLLSSPRGSAKSEVLPQEERVVLRMLVTNVNYDSLVANEAIASLFLDLLKEEVAASTGAAVGAGQLDVQLLRGGTMNVEVVAIFPAGATILSVDSASLCSSFATKVATLPNIDFVRTGVIGVNGLAVAKKSEFLSMDSARESGRASSRTASPRSSMMSSHGEAESRKRSSMSSRADRLTPQMEARNSARTSLEAPSALDPEEPALSCDSTLLPVASAVSASAPAPATAEPAAALAQETHGAGPPPPAAPPADASRPSPPAAARGLGSQPSPAPARSSAGSEVDSALDGLQASISALSSRLPPPPAVPPPVAAPAAAAPESPAESAPLAAGLTVPPAPSSASNGSLTPRVGLARRLEELKRQGLMGSVPAKDRSPPGQGPGASTVASMKAEASAVEASLEAATRSGAGAGTEGVQGLLREVYDKICACSARLQEPAEQEGEGCDMAVQRETWREIEWLREAVMGMHQHLLVAQQRQRVLEDRCKEYQRLMGTGGGGSASAMVPGCRAGVAPEPVAAGGNVWGPAAWPMVATPSPQVGVAGRRVLSPPPAGGFLVAPPPGMLLVAPPVSSASGLQRAVSSPSHPPSGSASAVYAPVSSSRATSPVPAVARQRSPGVVYPNGAGACAAWVACADGSMTPGTGASLPPQSVDSVNSSMQAPTMQRLISAPSNACRRTASAGVSAVRSPQPRQLLLGPPSPRAPTWLVKVGASSPRPVRSVSATPAARAQHAALGSAAPLGTPRQQPGTQCQALAELCAGAAAGAQPPRSANAARPNAPLAQK